MNQHRLSPVVLITGASSGIGRAAAVAFGARRARVALVARRATRLAEVAREIDRLGGETLVIPADVSRRADVESAIRAVEERWGRLDVLVNNAGYGVFGAIEQCLPDDFEQQMKTNYLGVVYAVKAALPLMRRQGSGAVINVSSVSGKATTPYDAAYCASKFALNAFTSTLQIELAGTGIAVSLVCPGYTKTEWETAVVQRRPFVFLGVLRAMSAERVAREIVGCVDKPKREILIPRVLHLLVWLQALFPGVYGFLMSRLRVEHGGR